MNRTLKALLIALTTFTAFAAQASGFKCMSVDEDTRIEVVFTPIHPDGSDRSPRVKEMTILDPNVSKPYQHIATFRAVDGLLSNQGGKIEALVDLRYEGSSRAGERVGGTRLGALKTIALDIDFSYNQPAEDGDHYSAGATYMKRNGTTLTQDFDCVLFLDSKSDFDLVSRLNSTVH